MDCRKCLSELTVCSQFVFAGICGHYFYVILCRDCFFYVCSLWKSEYFVLSLFKVQRQLSKSFVGRFFQNIALFCLSGSTCRRLDLWINHKLGVKLRTSPLIIGFRFMLPSSCISCHVLKGILVGYDVFAIF